MDPCGSEPLTRRELKYPEETKTPYGYIPHFGINVTFLAVYAILVFASIIWFLSCIPRKHRKWLPRSLFVLIAVGIELAGFVERVRSANNPRNYHDFFIQLTLLNSAPAFITAAISVSMHQLLKTAGHHRHYNISPNYCFAFGILDLAAAAFVIFGSLTAFNGGTRETLSSSSLPKHAVDEMSEHTRTFLKLIVTAMAIQIVSISIFLGLLIAATWHRARVPMRIPKDFVFCMVAAGTLVMIRAAANISEGGSAPNEWLFFGLDSILMVVAAAAMVAGHPILSWTEQPIAGRDGVVDDEESLATAGEQQQEQDQEQEQRQQKNSMSRQDTVEMARLSPRPMPERSLTWANGKGGGDK